MVNRLFNPRIVRFAALAALLALALVLAAPVAFAQDSSIPYPENGMDPVATYTASDQDDDPIEWDLSGADAKLFTIEGGVLAFVKSPDYEKPGTALGGTIADRNVYNVTIKATGGEHDVAITVTNEDEDGEVSFNKPQPQAGRGLEATLDDQDGGVSDEEWQWARSEDGETWADIEGATSQSRSPASADVGSYLRATVTYTDLFDSGKTVSAVTNSRVEAKTVANAAPSFEDQDETAADVDDDIIVNRSVNENAGKGSAVGKPVSATDSDSDVLIYTLEDGDLNDEGQHQNSDSTTDTTGTATPSVSDGDSRHFTIDRMTGQIKIDVEDGLDFEDPASIDTDGATNSYVVRVIATDPSGAPKAQEVTIMVANVNEAPDFGESVPTTLRVKENGVDLLSGTSGVDATDALPATAYVATEQDEDDEEAIDTTDNGTGDTTVVYAVEGADKKYFRISNTAPLGVLTINHDPDDEGIADADADDAYQPNYEAKSSYSITITATSGAGNRRLTTRQDVTVNVLDGEDGGKVALSQREPQVGQTVIATLTDPDGGITVTKWEWARVDLIEAVGTTPASCPAPFADSANGGEVIEDASSAAYTPVLVDKDKCLQARVTYTDNIAGDGEGDSPENQDGVDGNDNMDGVYVHATTEKDVQISDPANTAPLFPDQDPTTSGDQSDEASRTIAENTKADQSIGAPVTAGDSNGDLLLYSMSGPDADSFKISKTNGQLMTKADLDFESKDTYTVVVNATDPSGAADSILVTINVTDENDPAEIAGASARDYPENGTDPVATYTASDQDDDPIEWDLSGADAKLFTIGGGVLAFVKSPDYEKPASAVTGGTRAEQNVYNVTLEATGGEHDVAITVTNEDEDGEVSFNKPQPQAGRGLEATLDDQDGGVSDEEWQWARSEDGETWADIEGATSQSRSPASADVGSYLRATVTYTDLFDSGKTVSAVTNSRVEAKTVANAAPSFEDQDETAADVDDDEDTIGDQDLVIVNRSVNENAGKGSAVGKPVSATDSDSDVLIYTLEDGDLNDEGQHQNSDSTTDTTGTATPSVSDGDSRHFTIDRMTGQIKIDVEDGLDFEDPASIDTDGATNSYVVRVIATDPSGAPKAQEVTIMVANVNEAPDFGESVPTTLRVRENGVDLLSGTSGVDATDALPPTAYVATEYDTDDANAIDTDDTPGGDTTVVYAVEGADKKYFLISDDGVLTIDPDPNDEGLTGADTYTTNYEAKDSYSITITATSGAGNRRLTARQDVTVNVLDGEDGGKVALSQREPQVGQTVIATLTDPDGGITVTKWEWAGAPLEGDGDCPVDFNAAGLIDDASSAAYTPVLADRDMCLQARVTYTDNIAGDGEESPLVDNDGDGTPSNTDGVYVHETTEAEVQVSDPANTAPLFPDQDPTTSGDQSDEASRSIAENTKADQSIGAPVTAGDSNGDLLLYSMSGPDADSFKISRSTGQLTTKAALDFESKATYMVVVNATDPSGAQDSILVTINVTDEDDAADITQVTDPVEPEEPENNAPEFAAASAARSVAENTAAGMPVGAPVTATDADNDDLTYTLGGSDAGSFAIDAATGQIMTSAALDHETAASYSVTVTADDGNGGSDSITVAITVTDVGLANAYDTNDSGAIDKEEVLAAVDAYFDGTLSKADVLDIVDLYFG